MNLKVNTTNTYIIKSLPARRVRFEIRLNEMANCKGGGHSAAFLIAAFIFLS